MPKGLPFRLRFALAKLREDLCTRRGTYPATAAALTQLEAALETEFPRRHAPCKQLAVCSMRGLRVQMYRQLCCRLKRKVEELEAQLASHTAAKLAGGRLSEDCFVRILWQALLPQDGLWRSAFGTSLAPKVLS